MHCNSGSGTANETVCAGDELIVGPLGSVTRLVLSRDLLSTPHHYCRQTARSRFDHSPSGNPESRREAPQDFGMSGRDPVRGWKTGPGLRLKYVCSWSLLFCSLFTMLTLTSPGVDLIALSSHSPMTLFVIYDIYPLPPMGQLIALTARHDFRSLSLEPAISSLRLGRLVVYWKA